MTAPKQHSTGYQQRVSPSPSSKPQMASGTAIYLKEYDQQILPDTPSTIPYWDTPLIDWQNANIICSDTWFVHTQLQQSPTFWPPRQCVQVMAQLKPNVVPLDGQSTSVQATASPTAKARSMVQICQATTLNVMACSQCAAFTDSNMGDTNFH